MADKSLKAGNGPHGLRSGRPLQAVISRIADSRRGRWEIRNG